MRDEQKRTWLFDIEHPGHHIHYQAEVYEEELKDDDDDDEDAML